MFLPSDEKFCYLYNKIKCGQKYISTNTEKEAALFLIYLSLLLKEIITVE
jgi:hypothetical protein